MSEPSYVEVYDVKSCFCCVLDYLLQDLTCECRCRWKVKSKRLERDVEKHRRIGEMAERRRVELEEELDALKAQRHGNIQQFEQLRKQFTDILVATPCRLT